MYEWSEDLCNDPDGIRDIFFTNTIKLYSYENIPAKMRDTRERYDFIIQCTDFHEHGKKIDNCKLVNIDIKYDT